MRHPHAGLPVAILVSLISFDTASAKQNRSDAAAIDRARRVSVAALDPALPAQSFEQWFRRVLDSPAAIEWEVNDCGEQTGDPSVDRNRDLPICAEARGALRSAPGLERSFVVAQIVVGTDRTGVTGPPRVWWISIELGATIQEVDTLGRLEAAIAAWRDGPSPYYRPDLPAAVASCCAGLRLPGARDMRAPWSLSNPNYAIEGDFNGDGALDIAVLLIDSGGKSIPTLAVFHQRLEGRFALAHHRRLDQVDDVSIDAPQEIVLRLVKRGETWAPESGDAPMAYPHAFDAIEFSTHKVSPPGAIEGRLHLAYWNGRRYAEY